MKSCETCDHKAVCDWWTDGKDYKGVLGDLPHWSGWHDLREDPDDLPEDDFGNKQLLFAWLGSDGCVWYEAGWFYNYGNEKYFSFNDIRFSIGEGYREVFAWHELPKFER